MKIITTTCLLALAQAAPVSAQIAETPEIAMQLRAMGSELSRELVGGTNELYAPLHAQRTLEGLIVVRELSYGSDERHVLDVFAPEDADGSAPVMVFVHGGGFVRGDKADVHNIGHHFARNGVVTIAMNYRLAPDNVWPSGAEDVKLVVDWIGENVAEYGGDAAKIVLAGNSAGAMHVSDYTFHEDQQSESDGVIGAIIISPPTVDLNAREIDPTRDALYYGTDGDRSLQSVINALDGREIPVMVAYAQYEPDVIIDQTRILIDGLSQRDGRMPLVAGIPGHNHISVVKHIGTADESLARAMLGFIGMLTLPPG